MIVTEDRIGILEEIEQKMKEERIEIYGLKLKKVEGQLKLTYQLMYPAGYQKHRFVMKLYREMTLKAVSE